MSVNVLHGDMLAILPTLPAESFHACVTDPPYHLTSIVKRFGGANAAAAQHGTDGAFARTSAGFMGKRWDGGDIAFRPETWAEVLRVLKPGAYLLAFGAPRGWHRMVCAIEDAGFEIRDQISNLHDGELSGPLLWCFGSGFPKSHDVSRAIDRAAGAEREVVGTTERRVGPQGTRRVAGLSGSSTFRENPDNPGNLLTAPATEAARQWSGWGTALKPAWEGITVARKPLIGNVAENVLAHGCGAINVDACRVAHSEECRPMKAQDASKRGDRIIAQAIRDKDTTELKPSGRWPANLVTDGSPEVLEAFARFGEGHARGNTTAKWHAGRSSIVPNAPIGGFERGWGGDSGSAARFFYSSKADATDRLQSKHPTVKPVDLMQWLLRMVVPPGGRVLDPFAGSGTTGMAAMAEGFDATLVERELEYVADIRRRIAHVSGDDTPLFASAAP